MKTTTSTIKLTHQELRDLIYKIADNTKTKELENGSVIANIYSKLTIAYYELPQNLR
tara:strand:- start:525 stop:695 length:171 start_codon:yes stop_codon:yes gene_type:complete